jgi:cardiolipin synthase A/B
MAEPFDAWWTPVSTVLMVAGSLFAASHAVLVKRDVRSAAGWVALICLVPGIGAFLYVLLGINRIRRRASLLRQGMTRVYWEPAQPVTPAKLVSHLSLEGSHLSLLARAIDQVTARRLLPGNRVQPLVDGDEAYPEMIGAIEAATRTVCLSSYIFETTGAGGRFIDALASAMERGVQVRVLIDDVGARYTMPRPERVLRRRGVRAASFMPALRLFRPGYLNLRNHRKILVVDGRVAFTGGLNIRKGHMLSEGPRHPTRDLHFRLEGPVVAHLSQVFAEDWAYTTKERLEGPGWFPELESVGDTFARGIADGPDEDFDRFTWTLHSALACARRSVIVMSPYFLPDTALATALNAAALRGVDVRILIPRRSNLLLVQWAMGRQLEEVLGHGCRVWQSPAPFDHTKLVIVDQEWTLLGSANWDTRSLRLNFELDVECYDRSLASLIEAYTQLRWKESVPLTLEDLQRRPLWERLRDGYARLLMPYL